MKPEVGNPFAELERLRTINKEIISLILDDKDGDLDFVQWRVRAVLAEHGEKAGLERPKR
jgi:hypothetical protein